MTNVNSCQCSTTGESCHYDARYDTPLISPVYNILCCAANRLRSSSGFVSPQADHDHSTSRDASICHVGCWISELYLFGPRNLYVCRGCLCPLFTMTNMKNRFIGDFAYLYDISPLYTRSSPSFYNVQNLAFVDWLGGHAIDRQITQQIADSFGIEIVGVLNSQSTAGSLAPVWDLTQTYGSNAIAFGKVVGDLPSPYWDPGNVDWLHLTVTSGGLAQDILRVYTNGGEPLSHVSVFLSVMCTARLNVAYFRGVTLDQQTFRSHSPHSIVSAQLLTPK